MPFEQFVPRSFTAGSIQRNSPAQSGVYGISNASGWLYIGESDNIQDALLTHLHKPDSPLMQQRPKGFVFEVCDLKRRMARQSRLVFEYEPACNRRSAKPRAAAGAA
jgi:hypothetical protein